MKRRASEWSSIYLLIVVAITAVLLVTFVKPLFKQAQETSDDAADSATSIAKGALFGLSVFLMPKKTNTTKRGKKIEKSTQANWGLTKTPELN